MAVDLRTTQEYLNAKLGTVGLTKQQCLQRLFGAAGQGMTAQDAALNYAGLNSRATIREALNRKVGIPVILEIDQSQTNVTGSLTFGDNSSTQKSAQQIIPKKGKLRSISIKKRTSTGTYIGDVTISLQTQAGTNPSGTALFTTTIPNATWEAISAAIDYDLAFVGDIAADGVTPYWLVFESSTQDSANRPNVAGATGNPYPDGTLKNYNGSSWSAGSTTDFYFKMTVETSDRLSTQEAARRL